MYKFCESQGQGCEYIKRDSHVKKKKKESRAVCQIKTNRNKSVTVIVLRNNDLFFMY